jgi:glutathionylspermidine amidase/synthetase
MKKIILIQLLPLITNNYKVLGIVNNVVAFSNNKINKKILNYFNGIFTGIRWQCVEFARRYMIINYRITFPQVKNAYEIFTLNYFHNIKTNSLIKINKFLNGSEIAPQVGNLLIWNKYVDNNSTGHIAVITKVKLPYYVEIAEQNWNINKFIRRLEIKYKNGYNIIDTNLIGWIHYL